MKVEVFPTQTILDICLQTTGTAESLFDILKLNSMSTIKLDGIRELEIIQPIKTLTVRHYQNNNIKPATGINRKVRAFSSGFSFGFK